MPYNGTSRLDQAIATQRRARNEYRAAQLKREQAEKDYKNCTGCWICKLEAEKNLSRARQAEKTAELRYNRARETVDAMKHPRGKK